MKNKYLYRGYTIVRKPFNPAMDPSYLIYNDLGHFLMASLTMIEAQDWIDERQALS
jgi:hypothetical protein